MKIIIYHPISPGHGTPETADHQPISSLTSLNSLIHFNPNQDIEGEIWPEAINLPDFKEILQAIYKQKEKFWITSADSAPSVDRPPQAVFAQRMVEKFNIDPRTP